MKKLLVFLVSMTIAVTSFAQVNFGVRAGAGTANISDVFGENAKSALNLYGGVFADFGIPQIVEGFGIRPEFNLSLQGGALKAEEIRLKARSYVLNIPIMAEYKFLSDKIALMVGPQFGFCLGGKNVAKSGNKKEVEKWDATDYNEFDFSFAFGGSILVTDNVGIDVRYNLGMTNVLDDSEIKSKDRVFQIGVFYAF